MDEIKRHKRELGEDYLYKEKERLKDLTREIIIAMRIGLKEGKQYKHLCL